MSWSVAMGDGMTGVHDSYGIPLHGPNRNVRWILDQTCLKSHTSMCERVGFC